MAQDLCPWTPNEEGICAADVHGLTGSAGASCDGFFRVRGREAERVRGTYSCSLCVTPPRQAGMTPGAPCKGFGTWSTEMLDGAWDCSAP